MQILHDEPDFVVLVKPAGTDSEKLCYKDVYGEAALGRLYCVHRLDRETGGVMVYAKNEKTAAFLSAGLADHRIQKIYMALCEGMLEPESGSMEDLLFHDRRTNKTYVVKRERNGVKRAVLHYETVNTSPQFTLCRVKLETGRTHQIRIQFASRKHPLAGDRRYGAKQPFQGLGLWSCELSMPHPFSGEIMTFKTEPVWTIPPVFR